MLLIFNREDPFIITLKNAILKCGFSVKCCRNIQETHEAFKKTNYDLVFIDSRRTQFQSSSGSVTANNNKSNTVTTSSSFSSTSNPTNLGSSIQYDYENICW